MSDKEAKNPITVKEEEVDLGKLFLMIGKTISNFFKSIGLIFKSTFHYFIVFLIFIKTHFIKIGIALIIGAIIGFFWDYASPQKYTYDMIIQPNYKSANQIFENIEYYNVLIENNDTISLAKEFNLPINIAQSLYSFALKPYETEKDQILAYDRFIKTTDTLTQKIFTYNDFKGAGTSKLDSELYVYRIISYIKDLESLEKEIIGAVEKNQMLNKRKKIKLMTLKLDSLATRNSLKDIDSLRSLYKKVTLLETQNQIPSTSTYLDFSKENNLNNDIELFRIYRELNENLIDIEAKKETSDSIVNVITTFNSAGKKMEPFYQTKMFQLSMLFGMLVLFSILIKKLNNYLINYQSRNS